MEKTSCEINAPDPQIVDDATDKSKTVNMTEGCNENVNKELNEELQETAEKKVITDVNFIKPTIGAFKLPSRAIKKQSLVLKAKTESDKTLKAELDEKSKPSNEKPLESKESQKIDSGVKSKDSAINETDKGTLEKVERREKKKKLLEPSPAEKLSIPPLPYKEPAWSGTPSQNYKVEVLKGGKIVEAIPLNDKPFHTFGRLEANDVTLEHPSLSRYHLVLQYRSTGDSETDPGFYLYDLDSTHGSFLNKIQLKPRVYSRIRVGHMFKMGGSSRLLILQGPQQDQDSESELSLTQLKEMRMRQLEEAEVQKMKRAEEVEIQKNKNKEKEEAGGIDWGMGDDVEEDIDMSKNPFEGIMTQAEKEATYIKDPKKTLRGYFEREGMELEYDVTEKSNGFQNQYVCKIELPIDDAEGEPIYAEAIVSGKKREAVVACALEACRILDARGVLRQAVHESKKRKKKNWATDDYYDSDEDTFLDRTGDIEKKRTRRMIKAGVLKQEVDDYDSLTKKLNAVDEEMDQLQRNLQVMSQEPKKEETEDSLDAFINQIKSGKAKDKMNRGKMKLRLIDLRKEQAKLLKLIKLVQPATIPGLPGSQSSKSASTKQHPAAARKEKAIFSSIPTKAEPSISHEKTHLENEEEDDDEEEEDTERGDKQGGDKTIEGQRSSMAERRLSETSDEPELYEKKKDASKPEAEPSVSVTNEQSSKRVHGPQIGPHLHKKPKRVIGPSMNHFIKLKNFAHRDETEEDSKNGEEKKNMEQPGTSDDNFSGWIPPDDQRGDGKTHLNAKFGY